MTTTTPEPEWDGPTTTLAEYVRASDADPHVAQCEAQAKALVAKRISGAVVPAVIVAAAELEVGADLFHRRSARNGVGSFGSADGIQPIRIARDPMRAADDILRPWLGPAIV